VQPALVLAHDGAEEASVIRVKTICADVQGLVVVEGDVVDLDEEGMKDALRYVPGGSSMRVVHLVGHGVPATLPSSLGETHRRITSRYPALHVEQWVVHAVGHEWDDDEIAMYDSLREAGAAAGFHGLLVTATSTRATAAATDEEQAVFAADVTMALVASSFGSGLVTGSVWVAGASSAYYSRRALARSVSGVLVVRVLQKGLLADRLARDPENDVGERWATSLDLASEDHDDRLRRDTKGGSVRARVALDVQLDEVLLKHWPDRLRTAYDERALNGLGRARAQIDRNIDEWRTQLRDIVEQHAVEQLHGCGRYASARWHWEGVVVGLRDAERDLLSRRAAITARIEELQPHHKALTDAIRTLPFPGSLAVRALPAAAALTALLTLLTPVVGGLAAALPPLAGAGVLGWAANRYIGGVARVRTAAETYLAVARRRLEALVDLHLLDRRIALVADVIGWVEAEADGMLARLDTSQRETEQARDWLTERGRHRRARSLPQSRFAVTLPRPEDVPTDAIADDVPVPPEAPQLLMDRLFTTSIDTTADEVYEAALALLVRPVEATLPATLADALDEWPSSKRSAISALNAPTVPIVRTDRVGERQTASPTSHLVHAPDHAGRLQALREEVVPFVGADDHLRLPAGAAHEGLMHTDLLLHLNVASMGAVVGADGEDPEA
jgi:hypothetical protein